MSYIPALHRRSGYHFHPVPALNALEAARRNYLLAVESAVRDGTFTAADAYEDIGATHSASRQVVQLVELDAKEAASNISRYGEKP